MNFPKTKKAVSTLNGVTFFKQFPKNFLRPYGQVDGPNVAFSMST